MTNGLIELENEIKDLMLAEMASLDFVKDKEFAHNKFASTEILRVSDLEIPLVRNILARKIANGLLKYVTESKHYPFINGFLEVKELNALLVKPQVTVYFKFD